MTPEQLQHGEVLPVAVQLLGGGIASTSPAKGAEVRLRMPRSSDEVLLAFDGGVVAVEGHAEPAVRRLKALRQLDPPRVCWLASTSVVDGSSVMNLMVHRFRSRYRWDNELAVGVDDRIVERVQKLAKKGLGVDEACQWLADRVLLPAAADLPRLVATGAPDQGGRFRLLGRGVGVDLNPVDGTLVVDRVVRLRKNRQGFRPPEFLIEAEVRFEDATITGKVRQSVRAQLDRIVAESDNSYLALWQKYQDVERTQLIRRARELGWVEYEKYEPLPSGLWAFKVRGKQELAEFRDRLPERQELESAARLPAELLDAEAGEGATADRPFIGSVERVRWDRNELLLRPFDEDSDAVPPPRGFLFGALQGDRKRLARREEAVMRLRSADARIPQLALILEDQPAPTRRTDADKPLSAAAKKVFKFGETPAQRRALDQALNTPDIALIQGPPGTGKTTVIAALQVRLAELEAEQESVGGRTLLTSYQHDAVDNAVERTSVYGLPPARFGGRRGSRTVEDQADRWARDAHEHVLAMLADLEEERPRTQYRHFRDRVATYASGQLPPEAVQRLMDDLIALEPGTLPTEVWDRLNGLRHRGARPSSGGDLEHELNLKRARGIPPQNTAFEDGGPRSCRRALQQLESMLSDDERGLLARAAAVEAGQSFDEIDVLAALRDDLIDRLGSDAVPGERETRDVEATEALNMALAALYTRMETTPGGKADALKEYADAIRLMPGEVIRTLRHYAAAYAATCQQAVGHAVSSTKGDHEPLAFENVVVDEAARANPLDLFIPMSLGKRRIILVGDHRQLPHLLEPDIERELSEGASKATEQALKQSLFERLFEDLRAREQRDGVRRVETLDQQFRMHPTLGEFVSDVFYAPHGEAFRSPLPAKEFAHSLSGWMNGGKPSCAAWKRLPYAEGKEERRGTSWARSCEASWIARQVSELVNGEAHDLTIGVITFYKAQVEAVLEAMLGFGLTTRDEDTGFVDVAPAYRTLDLGGKQVERLRVGTVDAFQGMEFDIVFLSVVRSNTVTGDSEAAARRRYGHLLLPNRLCVAMSRQKRLLVTVGDQEMFQVDEGQEVAVPGLARFLELCGGPDGLVV